jgi:hypothetical protein
MAAATVAAVCRCAEKKENIAVCGLPFADVIS